MRRLITILAAALLLGAVAACSSAPKAPPTQTGAPQSATQAPRITIDRKTLTLPRMAAEGRAPVRIGLLLPLTGPDAPIGRALLDAAQLAVFEAQRRDILLLPEDTQATPEAAAEAARRVLEAGAEIILGPLLSEQVNAASAYGAATGTPIIAFSSTLAIARPGVYLLSFPPELEVDRIVDFAVLRGYTRFAAMIPQTSYGAVVEQALRSSVALRNAMLVKVGHYPSDVSAMAAPVRELAQFGGFDAVLLPEGGTNLRGLAPLLSLSGVDPRRVKLLGTGLWDEPKLGREPVLIRGWFAAPPPEARQKFIARFEAAYGRVPPRLASLAYDAVALAASLADMPEGQRFTPARIANPNGFSGIDGIFRFLPDGRIERGLAVNEVQADGVTVISDAPSTFLGGGF